MTCVGFEIYNFECLPSMRLVVTMMFRSFVLMPRVVSALLLIRILLSRQRGSSIESDGKCERKRSEPGVSLAYEMECH